MKIPTKPPISLERKGIKLGKYWRISLQKLLGTNTELQHEKKTEWGKGVE